MLSEQQFLIEMCLKECDRLTPADGKMERGRVVPLSCHLPPLSAITMITAGSKSALMREQICLKNSSDNHKLIKHSQLLETSVNDMYVKFENDLS